MLKTREIALPKYPMWGHQGSLQWHLQEAAEKLFGALGPGLRPGVFVLGFKMGKSPYLAPVGLVPEETLVQPGDFLPLADQIAACRELAFVEKGQPGALVEDLRRELETAIFSLRESLEATLNALPVARDVLFCCSGLALVRAHLVGVVLTLDRAAYDSFPRLPGGPVPSLLDAAAAELLEVCDDELRRRQPGENMPWPNTKAMLESAGRKFAAHLGLSGGLTRDAYSLFDNFCTVASLRYEGSEAAGLIVFAHPGEVAPAVAFREPVGLGSHRAVRKLLELCSGELWLLSEQNRVVGVGRGDPADGRRLMVRFLRQHTWELVRGGEVLMRVTLGEASLPRTELPEAELADTLRRRFGGIDPADVATLTGLVRAAATQKNGTTVVITARPAEEAHRLRSQGLPIHPAPLDAEALRAVTNIDGAILVGVDGTCLAVGVILDGHATAKGAPSRGARYNSALRYVRERPDCIAVVLSEDGTADVLPRLMPRIFRAELDEALRRLRDFAARGRPNYGELLNAVGWFEAHRFYLQPAVCDEVNQLVARVEEQLSGDRRVPPFVPDEDMDESYFLDDECVTSPHDS
jgi:hypothetical protein